MILDNFVLQLFDEIMKVEDFKTWHRMISSFYLASKLMGEGKETEGLVIFQKLKNEVRMGGPDFYKQDDEKLISSN